jgi:arylsulfatase A-like enzyme
MIHHLDQSFKKLLDKLTELGLDKNTVVVFTSDNGGLRNVTSNKPFKGAKGELYEGGIRVSLIVRWPGQIKPGTVNDSPVYSTDFYPTFMEIAGLKAKPKDHVDGRSVLSAWKGKEVKPRTFYWHFPHRHNPSSSIVEDDWKLVYRIDTQKYELYELSGDKYEKKNMAGDKSDKVKELAKKLEDHLQELDAQRMVPNPNYDPSKPAGKGRNYGTFYTSAGNAYQQIKEPYPEWFIKRNND